MSPLLFTLALTACGASDPQDANLDGAPWYETWAVHTVFRDLDATGEDTASEAWLHMESSEARQLRDVMLCRGDTVDIADELLTLQLSTDGGLSVTVIDGESVEPDIVLLTHPFDAGVTTKTGDWEATPRLRESVETWYGTFDEALEITIEGPNASPLVGTVTLGQGVGPIEIDLAGATGDLAWYELDEDE